MSVTIRDVAAACGVSVSTVSKVLNGWTTISPATTERVNAAIRELHYTPNSRAVSFARKSTMNIVFLTSLEKEEAYKNPHMFDIMCGVYGELARSNYTVTLVDTSAESTPGDTVAKVIAGGAADGIIVHGSALNEENAALITERQFPHVVIGCPSFDNQLCWIDTNHMLGGQFAAEHLLACGYEQIAFVGGKKTDVISQQRLKGVRQTLLRSGHRMKPDHMIHTDATRAGAYEATTELLASTDRPDAIICENNLLALGVSKTIDQCSLHVPDEIAFLTFDRYPYSSIIDPAVTIIDIDVYDMGVQAGATIARKLANPALLVQSYTTLPLLIQGETTRHN